MKKMNKIDILEGNISKVLTQMTIPMIFGILGIVAFNMADTYFIGKLGTLQLAAISFTFPVVMVFGSINQGIGIGASAVISKAVGMKDHDDVKRHVTDSLLLGVLVSVVIATIGLLTINPLFRLIGADDSVMPIIKSYMRIWYYGAPFIVIPMIGNAAIRALGDTKTPSIVMLVAAGANIVLDPILIFGFGTFGGLGVQGAAIATVVSRFITFCVALAILIFREKVVAIKGITFKEVMQSWKNILFVGLPNALARVILPIGNGVITGLIAKLGIDFVAGYGIATRLDFFFLAVLQALSAIVPIFVGQNFGARNGERIKKGVFLSGRFAMIYGAGAYAVLFFLARPLAGFFSDNSAVVDVVVTYMRIFPLGYGLYGVVQVLIGAYNALQKPIRASLMNLLQVFALYIPLAIVSVNFFAEKGIFASAFISFVIVGIGFSLLWRRDVERLFLPV